MFSYSMENSPSNGRKMQGRKLSRSDLEEFLHSDAGIFPNCLTLDRLQSWYDKNSTNFLGHYLCDKYSSHQLSKENFGTLIAIPVKTRFWKQLITGDLEEHKITSEMILDENPLLWSLEDFQQGYAFHIWHVGKSALWNEFSSIPFKTMFWSELQHSISHLTVKKMFCIGFSALCATLEGARAFTNLQFQLAGYFDFIVENPEGHRTVIHSSKGQLECTDKRQCKFIFQCGLFIKLNPIEKIHSTSSSINGLTSSTELFNDHHSDSIPSI